MSIEILIVDDNADIRNIRITHRNGYEARVSKLDLALYFEERSKNLFCQKLSFMIP